MRRIFLLLLLAAILMQPVYAAQSLPLPPEAAEYLPEQTEDFGRGLWEILTKAAAALAPELRQAVISCVGVLAAVILCALFQVGDGTDKARTADILGAAAIAAMLLRPADALIQEAVATVRAISDYGKLLLPVMGSALASSGGASASAGLYFGTALFDSVLTSIVSGLLAPAIYLFLALAVGRGRHWRSAFGAVSGFFQGLHHLGAEDRAVSVHGLYGHHPSGERDGGCRRHQSGQADAFRHGAGGGRTAFRRLRDDFGQRVGGAQRLPAWRGCWRCWP